MSLRENLNVLGKKRKVQIFFCSNKKEVIKIDKDGNRTDETMSYKIKFIDSTRFMASSLSNTADNLTQGTHEIKCNYCNCHTERYWIVLLNVINVIQKSLMKNWKRNSKAHLSFLIMTLINLFWC